MRPVAWTRPGSIRRGSDSLGRRFSTTRVAGLDQTGIALVTTLLVVLVVGALVMGAVILGSNQRLVERYQARQAALAGLADAGLEMGRARLNGDPSILPESGFIALEEGVRLPDGGSDTIPGVRRWTYLGPVKTRPGAAPSPKGRVVNIVSVVRGDGGGMAVRRQVAVPESFARYGFFSAAPRFNLHLAGGEHLWGPVHANGPIVIEPSGATLHGPVTTAREVLGEGFAEFQGGLQEWAPAIPLPDRAEILALRPLAEAGRTAFQGTVAGSSGQATLRIQFIPVDLNQDGDTADEDEGFFRVYRSEDPAWVAATPPLRDVCSTGPGGGETCHTVLDPAGFRNCGDTHEQEFVSAADHDPRVHGHDGVDALRADSRRCYLGGSDEIWGRFVAQDGKGEWLPWTGEVDRRLRALRPDAEYLHPLSTRLNPGYQGVIFVEGKVLVSGQVRGRVTLVASDDIVLGDDLTYRTDPATGGCADLAGYVAGGRFVLANNALNGAWSLPGEEGLWLFDETEGEFIHGVVMALQGITAEGYESGSPRKGPCESPSPGRGCLYLTGGLIQGTPGSLGRPDGRGYERRLSYDQCAAVEPPPQFPATGVFRRGAHYPVDPTGFDLIDYFQRISSPKSLATSF